MRDKRWNRYVLENADGSELRELVTDSPMDSVYSRFDPWLGGWSVVAVGCECHTNSKHPLLEGLEA